jgi:hypothetical protein
MPIESMILLTYVTAYCLEYVPHAELSSAFIMTAPEGAAVVYITHTIPFLSYMT